MKVTKEKKKNVSRSKLFGIVINPKVDNMIDWKSMTSLEIGNKLKELKFPDRFVMTDILNQIRLENVNKNYTKGPVRNWNRNFNTALSISYKS